MITRQLCLSQKCQRTFIDLEWVYSINLLIVKLFLTKLSVRRHAEPQARYALPAKNGHVKMWLRARNKIV